MSSKKEEKGQVAAERIKAAAMSAAKGLSRAQAERAATAAARNVNAYGQKEEGPSRWQERKEAKRQMYLMSTEKAVKLGVRKDLKSSMSAGGAAASQCQKCFQPGHWTYECKNERVYISRPSRSQLLKNPARRQIVVSFEGNPDVAEVVDEEEQRKRGDGEEKKRKNSKRKQRSGKDSGSDTSEASVFESDSASSESESEYSSSGSSTSSYSSSDTEERRSRRRKKQKKQKRRHHRYSSSSDSESESDSGSDSDSDGRDSRKKSRRHNRRR